MCAGRQQIQLNPVRYRGCRARLRNHRSHPAIHHDRLALDVGVVKLAAVHPDDRRRRGLRAGNPARLGARGLSCIQPSRTQQDNAHWLGRYRAARNQALVVAIKNNHRALNRVGLLPQPRVAGKNSLVVGALQLCLLCNGVRRALSSKRHVVFCRALPVLSSGLSLVACVKPGRLYVSARQRITRLLRHIDLVGGQFDCAVLNPRVHRQVQPLTCALINGLARRRSHLGWSRCSGLCRRCLRQHYVPIQNRLLDLGSAAESHFGCVCFFGAWRKMRLQTVAARSLPGSGCGCFLNARMTHARHRR